MNPQMEAQLDEGESIGGDMDAERPSRQHRARWSEAPAEALKGEIYPVPLTAWRAHVLWSFRTVLVEHARAQYQN